MGTGTPSESGPRENHFAHSERTAARINSFHHYDNTLSTNLEEDDLSGGEYSKKKKRSTKDGSKKEATGEGLVFGRVLMSQKNFKTLRKKQAGGRGGKKGAVLKWSYTPEITRGRRREGKRESAVCRLGSAGKESKKSNKRRQLKKAGTVSNFGVDTQTDAAGDAEDRWQERKPRCGVLLFRLLVFWGSYKGENVWPVGRLSFGKPPAKCHG